MYNLKKQKSALNLTGTRITLLFLLLTVVYYLIFVNLIDQKDTAFFGGDTWEYQSMGVNFAMGHGIQKFGALESFETYKFEDFTSPPEYYDDFFLFAGNYNFVRTPAYPFFLGIVYKLFGVSPQLVKLLQLLMLVIVAATLPFIGYYYWEKTGLIGGIPAGLLYLAANYKLADSILTESLITFSVLLVLVAFIIYERWPESFTACMLGFTLGIALLVKGSLAILPILICCILLIRAFRYRNNENLLLLFTVVIVTMLTVLPWSIYASRASGQTIILSIQGSIQLLDDNNELCVDGAWHPEWVNNENAFYNNDGIDNSQALRKVVNFYRHHPALLPQCMYNKFLEGFGPMYFLWILVGFILLEGIFRLAGNKFGWKLATQLAGEKVFRIPLPFWIVGGNFLFITLIFHGEAYIVPSRFVAPMDFIFALLCCVAAVKLFLNIFSIFSNKPVF